MPKIKIRNLGPIRKCDIDVNAFTILTGAQASGKSTLAKAIYFFRTLKTDVYEEITRRPSPEDYPDNMINSLEKRIRSKFLRIFGSSWSMDNTMKLEYFYTSRMKLEIYLEPDRNHTYRNFVKVSFGEPLRDLVEKYERSTSDEYVWDQEERRENLRKEIQTVFADAYEIIYIPAGRSLTTVLTDQLAAMMDADDRALDYCMRNYIRLTLSHRSAFREGTRGMLREKLHTTQDRVDHEVLKSLQCRMDDVLCGRYVYDRGEERLKLAQDSRKYVKINYASSGQQETVWIFNLLYYYLLERRKVFLIVEEPEAHLFPEAQKKIAEALGIFGNGGNEVFVTTHSPYILGAFNNLLYASRVPKAVMKEFSFCEETFLFREKTSVWHICRGKLEDGLYEGFVRNELIDEASDQINAELDQMMEARLNSEEQDDGCE